MLSKEKLKSNLFMIKIFDDKKNWILINIGNV